MSGQLKKGARNGLQETPDRGEVRREAAIRGRLPDKDAGVQQLLTVQYSVSVWSNEVIRR